ncbi:MULTISPECIES: branched-chain amino acid ABC transporter permease [unclassified Candidatus Paralachnospira]|uniref:branched-chain amino acid ABC transporter permease n=1 Tax=unclassified Candidatus Paralachnospira TaxID=3099471 RepID=UPI003F92EFD3
MQKMKEFYSKYKVWVLLALFVVMAILPFVIKKTLYIRYLCNIMMYATLAGSLNAINGYSGQMCLGQAGFFAIGAYTSAALSKNFGISFWLLLLVGGILAMLVGFIVSLPTLRLNGIYLSITTLGASEIIRIIAQTWTPVTGGSLGIKQIPYPSFFGLDLFKPKYYYFIFLFLLVLFLFVTNRVLKSRVGRAWMSIREDQIAAKSLGVETSFYKSVNFMYGAFWAGVIGVAYAPFVNYIEASQFTTDAGFNVLAMVVLGGQGTLAGPILGAAVVTVLTEALRFLESWRYVIYAILIIAMMWIRPQGLIGASKSMLAGGKIKMKEEKAKKTEGGKA